MREFVTIKYGPIAEECSIFYDQLREKYPQRNVYKNTKEFRQWVQDEIVKYIENSNEQSENDGYAGQIQIEQSEANNNNNNETNNAATAGQIQIEQSEANNNNNNNETNNNAAAAGQIQIEQSEANNNNNNNNNETNNAATAGQIQIEQSEANNNNNNNETNNNAAAADAIQQADREINDIINELENGGVPLSYSDDEGIKLDLFEELRGITEDFDYEQEVEQEVFW